MCCVSSEKILVVVGSCGDDVAGSSRGGMLQRLSVYHGGHGPQKAERQKNGLL
jgi:hypothetical protein